MVTAQLLTLTDGVDKKVTRIVDEVKGMSDTVRAVQNGTRSVIFSYLILRKRLCG